MTANKSNARKGQESTDPPAVGDLNDPESNEELLRAFIREQLQPAVDDLAVAPVISSVDNKEVFVEYLLRAAEFGELAQSALTRTDGLEAFEESQLSVLEHAYQTVFSAASFIRGDNPRHLRGLVNDVERLVEATESVGGSVDVDVPGAPEYHPNDTACKVHSEDVLGTIEAGDFIFTEWESGDYDEAVASLQVHPDGGGSEGVCVSAAAEATGDTETLDYYSTMNLTPDQAEQFAKTLLNEAEAAREAQHDGDN